LDGLSFVNLVGNEDSFNCWGEVINGEVDGGEIGDLSIAAETEVGEAVIPDVGGNGLIGEFTVGGLG
jgi:hypothetical protein